jgi:ribosomal protein S13
VSFPFSFLSPELAVAVSAITLIPDLNCQYSLRICIFPGLQNVPAGYLNIRCARVGGVEVPNAKRIEVSLQYIHGVGKTTARQILLDVELENKLTKELTEEELTKLRDEVSKYMTEGDLVRSFSQTAMISCRVKSVGSGFTTSSVDAFCWSWSVGMFSVFRFKRHLSSRMICYHGLSF